MRELGAHRAGRQAGRQGRWMSDRGEQVLAGARRTGWSPRGWTEPMPVSVASDSLGGVRVLLEPELFIRGLSTHLAQELGS